MTRRQAFLSVMLLLALSFNGFSAAPESRAASSAPEANPSPGLDMNFLLLPAYDFDRVEPLAQPNSPTTAGPTRVGDRVELVIPNLTVPTGTSADDLTLGLPPGNSPLEQQGWMLEPAGSRPGRAANTTELHLTVVPIKSGQVTLPSLAVVDKKSGKPIARTNPFSLSVQSAISKDDPQPQVPAGPRPPMQLAFPWWFIALVAALAAAVLGVVVYLVIRWSRDKGRLAPAEIAAPPGPEDEEALAALLDLERAGTLLKGDFKTHYFRVSEILKRYIGRRYEFDAPESTTAEMLSTLDRIWGKLNPKLNERAQLETLFARMDLVKFTDHRPASEEAQKIVPEARKFIQGTRRRASVEPILQGSGQSPALGQSHVVGGGVKNAP